MDDLERKVKIIWIWLKGPYIYIIFFFGRLLPSGVLSYNHCISSFGRRYILGTNECISLDV